MNLNHVIIDLYPFSQFLIEYLKKSCTVNLSHFLTNIFILPETVWFSGSLFNRTHYFRYCKQDSGKFG